MDQQSCSPVSHPYSVYPTNELNHLCSPSTLHEAFVPAGCLHLQHFDAVYPAQCSGPIYNTNVSSSLSPQTSAELDFGLLLPQYNNSPSPNQASLDPFSLQYGGGGEMPAELPVMPSMQPHRRPKSDHKSTSKGFKMKRQLHKRTNRPSPIFPSGCSTPISMIGLHSNPITAQPTSTQTSSLSGVNSNKLGSSNSREQTNKSLSVVMVHHPHSMQQLKDIEAKILKLQADRGKLLKQAHDRSQLGGAQLCPTKTGKSSAALNLYLSSVEQLREVENGLIEEGNCLMFKIGRLYSSLDCAIEFCMSLCCSGHSASNTISDCFPYINSLLSVDSENGTRIKVSEHSDLSFMQLDYSTLNESTSSNSLKLVLDALNKAMHHSQLIQQQGEEISTSIKTLRTKIQDMLDKIDDLCKNTSFETKLGIQAVIEGNISVVCAMQQIWDRTLRFGAETLSTITDSLPR